jgi:hypothetical protein
MTLLGFPAYDCSNESDVEQKFLYPLLTHPQFLEIPPKAILTKKSLGTLSFISKSSLPKDYVPDYLVFLYGFPVLVIEAKSPQTTSRSAISEARLYAQVLNESFPSGTNPISIVCGCNGREFLIGSWDSVNYKTFSCKGLLIGSDLLSEVRELIGNAALNNYARRIQRTLTRSAYSKPARQLGAQLFLERIRPNALAPYLNPLYEMFFRAEDPEKIQLILELAYVDTAELREYDHVLHAMLRQIERSHAQSQTIQTDRQREYTLTPELNRYQSDIGSHGRLHLIIGARGSGKSLFIARFFTHLMPSTLRERAVWCLIDFNRAPSTIDNIEDYICEKFIEGAENIGFDPFGLEGLNRIFSVEINRLQRGPLSLLADETERQRIMAAELLKLSSDKRALARRVARHITGDMDRPLIVVFDNVDRRESAQQLKIFQAAQWFRNETRAFALLTLRDVTFERYKGEPPLDAFAQISNFYIRPPRFSLVLQKRLSPAIDEGLKDLQEIEQPTSTGLRFRYSKEHLGAFLQHVYDALFGGEHQVGRIVDALAERDVREALGMFARILASGHFNADRVIGIGTGGSAKIEHDQLIKILMRSDYRLYSEQSGFIHNIFWTPTEQFSGNAFLTAEILGFFAQEGVSGSDKIAGYWRLEELQSDLSSMGFQEGELRAGVQNLVQRKMLAFDGEDTESPDDEDLIKITPSGFIHLRTLPYFIEYLSSVALYCPVGDATVTRRITELWTRAQNYPDLGFSQKHEVASIFRDYLVREKVRLDVQNPLFRERCREAENLVRAITQTVNQTQGIADGIRARYSTRGPRSNTSQADRRR